MAHKLSLRQYKRLLGIQSEEQLAGLLNELEGLDDTSAVSATARTALKGLRQFFSQVDEAYEQADRDVALGKRSLELSSDELMNANRTLRQESDMRQHVMQTLRSTTNEVLSQLGKRLADEDSLENLSTLLSGLVSDILSTRAELQEALAAIKNQQFALDEHAIVSITDANGNLIYANDRFCQISQYAREELLGVNHRIVNSSLHSLEFFQQMWQTITQGQVWHGDIRNRAKDGSYYWTNATIVPFLDADGKPYQFISIRTDITQERMLKEEIEASKRLLQNVMNTLGEGVYTLDADGCCTFLNPEAENILGWSLDEVRGKLLHDVIHSHKLDGTCITRAECPITCSVSEGRVFRSDEEYFEHKSGNLFPVSIVASPIFEDGKIVGSVAAFQDISARHAADAALRQSEHKQRMMLDNAADAVFVAGKDERWIYVNDLALSMLGFAREELIGTYIYDLLPQQHRDSSRQVFGEILYRDKLVRQEIKLLRKDGGQVPVEMNAALLPDGSIYGSCRDITSRKEFEAALIKAKKGAEAASMAKSEFLATMSHEIRTPMNGIIGMTELALDTDLAPQQREYLELVKVSSHSLLGIINDILDFSKIESGKMVLEKIEFPIRELIASTLKALALRAEQKNIELVYKIDPSIPELIKGDPGRLRQVLNNLIGNAIKFSEHGEISLIARCEHQDDDGLCIYFSVTDEGIGIPSEKLQDIFQAFSQADASTTRKYGGTGLGLSISSRLVESMQGQLQVESEINKGSCFFFTAIFDKAVEEFVEVPPLSLQNMRVLIVDDNAINRQYLFDTLVNWQVDATVLESGEEALKLLQEKGKEEAAFDLIISDVCMPSMDGFDFIKASIDQKLKHDTKILMLSSAGGHDDARKCVELGIEGYVRKPISQQELQFAIEAAFKGVPSNAFQYRQSTQEPIVQERSHLKVLVAEDNVINQRLALSLLEKWGHQASLAENGAIAVEMFKLDLYDVILMDMQMPEMGGIEATEIIRKLERPGQHIPIIAMTANAMLGDKERCLEAGMDHYLSKPIKSDALKELLALVMARSASLQRRKDAGIGSAQANLVKSRASDAQGTTFDFYAAVCEGDEEVLMIITPMFLEGCDKQVDEICQAIASQDMELLYRSAHTMKGLVGNFGARPIEELAKALELKGKNRDNSRISIIFEQLLKHIPLLKEALIKYLATKGV